MATGSGCSCTPGPSPLSMGAEETHRRRTRRSSRLLDSDQGSSDSSSSNHDSDQAPEKMSVKEELPLPVKDIGQIEAKLEAKRKQRKETNNKEKSELDGNKEEKEKSRLGRHTPKATPRCNLACLSKMPNSASRSACSSTPGSPPLTKGAEGTHPMRTRRSLRLSDSDHGSNDSSSSNRDSDQAPEMMLASFKGKEALPLPVDELEVIGLREDHEPPEKKRSIECEPEVPNIVTEEKPDECVSTEECKYLEEVFLENESKKMPSLTESDQHPQDPSIEEFETLSGEMDSIPYTRQEADDAMPQIGPETLVCHEVDLDDSDEEYKSCAEPVAENSESNTPTSDPPTLPPSIQANLSEALLSLGQESCSITSESDLIDVDSLAEGSQEGLCERESAGGFEASTTSSSCSRIIQAKDLKGEAAQSSQTEDLPTLNKKCSQRERSSTSKMLTRSPARGTSPPMKDVAKDKHREKTPNVPAKTYTWSFPPEILDNMTSEERIVFIQAKMEEMMQRYSDLQSEVAAIDQMKRFKKKGRKVTLPGASKSSASSEAGVSAFSSSPPQNTATVECS